MHVHIFAGTPEESLEDDFSSDLFEPMYLKFDLSTFTTNDGYRVGSADLKLYRVEECSGQEDQGYRATVWVIKPNGECHDKFIDL